VLVTGAFYTYSKASTYPFSIYNMQLLYSTLIVSALASCLVAAVPVSARGTTDLQLNARQALDTDFIGDEIVHRSFSEEDEYDLFERDSIGGKIKDACRKVGDAIKKCAHKLVGRDGEEYEVEITMRDESFEDEDGLAERGNIAQGTKHAAVKVGQGIKSACVKMANGVKQCAQSASKLFTRDEDGVEYSLVMRDEEGRAYEIVLRDGADLEDADALMLRDVTTDEKSEDRLALRDLALDDAAEAELSDRSFKSFFKKIGHGLAKVGKGIVNGVKKVASLVMRDVQAGELE